MQIEVQPFQKRKTTLYSLERGQLFQVVKHSKEDAPVFVVVGGEHISTIEDFIPVVALQGPDIGIVQQLSEDLEVEPLLQTGKLELQYEQ